MDFESKVFLLAKAGHDLEDLSKQPGARLFDLCDQLYKNIQSSIKDVDAFYVGIYDEKTEQIRFPLTIDEGKYDRADYQPLGDGPTSEAIRNQETFVLTPENVGKHQSGSNFGNMKKKSKSAVHAPIFATNSEGKTVLVGVMSIQSYTENAFDSEVIEAITLLARSAGKVFLPFAEENTITSLKTKLAKQTNIFNKFLFDLTEQLDSIKQSIKRSVPPSEFLEQLKTCSNYCIEIQSNMISSHFRHTSLKEEIKKEMLKKLSPSEKKVVLRFMERKEENKDIAKALNMNHDLVKKHIQNACSKLGIDGGREELYNLLYIEEK